jgi:hypothetical protein
MSISLTGKLSVIKWVLLNTGLPGIIFFEQDIKSRAIKADKQRSRDFISYEINDKDI